MMQLQNKLFHNHNKLTKGWTIRPAEDGDAVAIRAVAAETWAVTYAKPCALPTASGLFARVTPRLRYVGLLPATARISGFG